MTASQVQEKMRKQKEEIQNEKFRWLLEFFHFKPLFLGVTQHNAEAFSGQKKKKKMTPHLHDPTPSTMFANI